MSTKNLTAYLKEHAAAASAALDLLDHLVSSHADTPDADFFKELRAKVNADKTILDGILGRFETGESVVLNTMTWIGEKFARIKFRLAGADSGELGRLEALEMLSLGIEGKRVLWLALEAAAIPELQDMDLPSLAISAAGQRELVELRRLTAARNTLGTTG